MSLPWITAILLATSWTIVTSEFNPEVCSVVKESYGLVPPPIPRDFELRREIVDYSRQETAYEEIYFDNTNSREKYVYLTQGKEQHFLFDYEVQQFLFYERLHPYDNIKKDPMSHYCKAMEFEDLVPKQEFGFDDDGMTIKMRAAFEELGFGGKFQYAYNKTDRMENRGLLVDKFIGCIYQDNIDATMNISYLFTSKTNLGVGTAAGTLEKVVTGIDNGFLSVPVKADIFGTVTDAETNNLVPFNRTYNYFWFKGEPEFKMDTFRVPPYLYCEDYRGRKEMPKFPTAFSTRVQRTELVTDQNGKAATTEITSFETIYYYQEKKLARRDFTPGPRDTDIKTAFETMSPVRTVYDFSEGLMYISNIASGRCYIRPISHADHMEAGDEDNLYINMGTPEHIFQMESENMEYVGKDFTRDIECDVWVGQEVKKKMNATFVKETYISTNGWHELTEGLEEFGVPIKHSVIQKELNHEPKEGVTAYSFLKFKAKAPPLRNFDVSNCIEAQNTRDFAIFLTIPDGIENLLFKFKYQFLDAAQYYINDAAQLLSPLRVQRVQFRKLSHARNLPAILFTLVDKIKLKVKVPIGQRGASLDEAIRKLQTVVDTNQFAIKFYPADSKRSFLIPALKGSLYVRKSDGDLTYFVPVQEQMLPSTSTAVPTTTVSKDMHDDPTDLNDLDSEGMTSGSLTLLSFAMLFIGIGIGVCIMYLYLRHQRERKLDDRIQLSLQTSQNGTKEVVFAENAQ